MFIHVVQPGDTIQSIAKLYGISVTMLIRDNGLENPNELVIGQSIVIAHPEITYTVKEGDSIEKIAKSFNVTIMQLLINNPYLSSRQFIYPGDIIVIKYNTKGKITCYGNALPYMDKNILRRTLPYLTYLSVLNYTATNEGEIISYYDDTQIIEIAKQYSVKPLMLLTTLTIQGKANIQVAYDLLLNEKFQNKQIDNILNILKTKGYYGINISFEYISISNIQLYEEYINKITNRMKEEGYLVFVTINPNISNIEKENDFKQVDYTLINQLSENIIFMDYQWSTTTNPPSPVSSIQSITAFLNYILRYIPPSNVIIGMATIGYDWELPYSAGLSNVTSLTLDRAIALAYDVGATIQFDDVSQTPYYLYNIKTTRNQVEHIVWFTDARSINALLDLVNESELHGIGVWNITIYNTQLWLVVYSQYEIEKIL
jgi:spore germination protein